MSEHDRLVPALLDRLVDDGATGGPGFALGRQQLRMAVMRDLAWLLNAVQPLGAGAAAHRGVSESVVNYGLPATAGLLASRIDVHQLERDIHEAIARFEPRILADSLQVRAREFDDILALHNVVEFEIRGLLWAQPMPMELSLRTQIDLEAGQVQVVDSSGGTARRAP